jgi:hypothetical protein
MAKDVVEVAVEDDNVPEAGIVQATHGSPDHPLRIGDVEIPCYVLENDKRVVVLSGMLAALNMSQGTAGRGTGNRLTKFIQGKALRPYIPDELAAQINHPFRFRTTAGALAYGYEATVIADLCDAIVEASQQTKLNYQLEHIVKRAEILRRGFQKVGVIALVDEATGFQQFRAREALEMILQKFISNELLKWAKTFPDEFYRQLFRLRGWKYEPTTSKRTAFIGRLTNDLVYQRLAPGVLEELKKITPKDDKGRRKHKYHQRLTEDIGHPRLREHLASVITLMRASTSWNRFQQMLDMALPRYSDTLSLQLDYPD